MRRALRAVLAAALVAATATAVEPNGGTLRLANAPAGPYLLSVWTQPDPPRVGRVDLSVAVMEPATGKPVLDATVRLRAELIEGGRDADAMLERGAGGNLLLYHGELEVPAPGPWRLTVEVEGPVGRGKATFEFNALPPRPVPWSWLLGAVGLFVIGTLGWLRARAKRSKGAAETNGTDG